jgi:hypothetical protein
MLVMIPAETLRIRSSPAMYKVAGRIRRDSGWKCEGGTRGRPSIPTGRRNSPRVIHESVGIA